MNIIHLYNNNTDYFSVKTEFNSQQVKNQIVIFSYGKIRIKIKGVKG